MEFKESKYFQDWYKIGEKDIKRAKKLLDWGDLEGAGFNIQQAVEKYLKGFLLSRGWMLRRIHNLETLLEDAIIYEASLEKFRIDCQKATYYYIKERYPLLVVSELTQEEVKGSLESANKLISKIVNMTKKDDRYGEKEE